MLGAALGPTLGPAALAALAPFTDVVEVGAGAQLLRAGVIPRQLTVLVAGHAIVRPADAPEWTAEPGAHFGADELVRAVPARCTVATVGPTARVLVVFGPAVRWAAAGLLGAPA